MKRTFTLFLAVLMCLSLCACGKNEAVKNTESLIAAIGEVTLDSESAIVAAEEAYAALTAEEKEKVENYTVLTDARTALDSLIMVEEAKQKYMGAWINPQSYAEDPNSSIHFYLTEENYGTEWSIDEGGSLVCSYYGHPVTVEEENGVLYMSKDGERFMAKAENMTTTEIEITMDNWQDYFTMERRTDTEYNAFGDLISYGKSVVLSVKDEYIDRLCVVDNTVTFELIGTQGTQWSYFNEEEQQIYATVQWDYIIEEEHTQIYCIHEYLLWQYYHLDEFNIGMQYAVSYMGERTMEYEGQEFQIIHVFVDDPQVNRVTGTLVLFDNPLHFD